MDSERLPNQAYCMLMNLDSNGKCNWASSIRSVLQSLGFGYVWLAQGVTRENCFLHMFKQSNLQMCLDRTGWPVLILVTVLPSIASLILCWNQKNILTADDDNELMFNVLRCHETY